MGKKILLVADQRHERDIIKLALSPLGYTLIESESSGSALAAIASHPDIAMIIIDWDLGDNQGDSAFNILYENFTSIPIFVIGNDQSNNAIVSTISLGAVDYMPKPINKEHLSFMVDNILNPNKIAARSKATRKQVLFPATSQIELISISKQMVEFKLNFSIPEDTVTIFTCNDLAEILEISFKTRFSCKITSCDKKIDSQTRVPYYLVKANFLSLSPLIASKIENALSKNLFSEKMTNSTDFIP